MKNIFILIVLIFAFLSVDAKEIHVSQTSVQSGDGSTSRPYKTINEAAGVAIAGDIVVVHEGVYREMINPANSGKSDNERIIYRTAEGEKVEVKGSEVITGWKKQKNGTWSIYLPDYFFNGNNSCKTKVSGDWIVEHDPKSNRNHTADLYIDGHSMFEADSLCHVVRAEQYPNAIDSINATYRWFSVNDDNGTIIYANFKGADPNKTLIEISVRPSCFYPEKQGINYITVSGFDFSQAATQWGAPTANQVGMIATHWNKGWIIENNVIHDTKCSGITLGKDYSTGHNVWMNNAAKDGSLHYIETTFRAIEHGWNRENIGSHIVRNNQIYNCEQTGICGSMGCAFSEIYNNHIYNIWVKRQFDGAEIAAIKFHAAIDTYIHDNYMHNNQKGIWLDWMTQGTRVSANLLHDNLREDIFMEVSHGPFIVDNNICMSNRAIVNLSQGGAYIHNILCGNNYIGSEYSRYTPYHHANSTRIKGLSVITSGDDRYIQNVFMSMGDDPNLQGLQGYNTNKFADTLYSVNNVYYNEAKPYNNERSYVGFNDQRYSGIIETSENGDVYLTINLRGINNLENKIVSSKVLGKTKISEESFTDPSGKEILFNRDYFNKLRSTSPSAGAIEKPNAEISRIKVWPK